MGQAISNLSEGELKKQIGLSLVAQGSEEFLEVMRAEAKRIARVRGQVSADDLRPIAKNLGIEPHHPNAWGALFRGSDWIRIGFKNSTCGSRRAGMVAVWKLRSEA